MTLVKSILETNIKDMGEDGYYEYGPLDSYLSTDFTFSYFMDIDDPINQIDITTKVSIVQNGINY